MALSHRWYLYHHQYGRSARKMSLDAIQRAALASIGVAYLQIGGESDIEDVDGAYDAYLRRYEAEAIIMRPDFYVFGVASSSYRPVDARRRPP